MFTPLHFHRLGTVVLFGCISNSCKSIVITYHQKLFFLTLVVWLASLPLLGSFGFSSAYHPGCLRLSPLMTLQIYYAFFIYPNFIYTFNKDLTVIYIYIHFQLIQDCSVFHRLFFGLCQEINYFRKK